MSSEFDIETEQSIDKLFEQFNATPGCVVGVARRGKEAFVKAYGLADLDHGIPLHRTSSFYIASASKQFTAMSLLLLVEEGKVSLSDSVRVTIPELPDYANEVSLQHLLNHTSGIRDYFQVGRRAGYSTDYVYTDHNVLNIIIRQKNLHFQPGDEFQYSNSGYALLSMAIKRVSGMTLNQYAQKHIFGPLGMQSTRFQHDRGMVVLNRANGYTQQDGDWRMSNSMLDVVGDGGMYSTIDDMLKWSVNFNCPVVGGQALRQMQTKARLISGEEIEYGMGLAMDSYRGLARVRHAGGHAGYRANFEHFPSEQLTVVLLCNNTGLDFFKLTQQVAEQYLGSTMNTDLEAEKPKSQGSAASPIRLNTDRLHDYSGEYWSGELRSVYRFFVDSDILWYEASDEEPHPTNSLTVDEMRNEDFGINFTFYRNSDNIVIGFAMKADSVREIIFQKVDTLHILSS